MRIKLVYGVACVLLLLQAACTLPNMGRSRPNNTVPPAYSGSKDSVNTGTAKWREFFTDPNLVALIDSALTNNQELHIMLQEINVARSAVRAAKGSYLPAVEIGAGGGAEKVGRYTSQGASDAAHDIVPGRAFPEPLPNYLVSADVSWEVDIWKKLRNAKKAAVLKYLSTVEGRNFMVTRLVAEMATSYYELMALDNQLEILRQNIAIQQEALEIVRLEKQSAKVTELAVRRFEAEVLKNQSRQFDLLQKITETENRINFLAGRFPQPVVRSSKEFNSLVPPLIHAGVPSQLLANRTDIRQTEQELAAAKLEVKAVRAEFYPTFIITAGAGFGAFSTQYLFTTPESMIYGAAGRLVAPLINRSAIKARYYAANARQIQAVYNYERTILRAYTDVVNQLSNISNLRQSYDLKASQVQALTQAIDISSSLFKSARADYMEVLLTQRDALESKFDLVETRMQQMNAVVTIYQALGGGWK